MRVEGRAGQEEGWNSYTPPLPRAFDFALSMEQMELEPRERKRAAGEGGGGEGAFRGELVVKATLTKTSRFAADGSSATKNQKKKKREKEDLSREGGWVGKR